jgi:CheY-like chemotaxis protein
VTTKGHILYCEDHDDTRVLMTIMLERAGFQVTAARTGADCLKSAQSGQGFDLYLLDNTLPDMSGVALCAELRRYEADTPILFYSARAMLSEREEAIKAGAQDYLIKPDDLFTIADHVAKWVTAKRKDSG